MPPDHNSHSLPALTRRIRHQTDALLAQARRHFRMPIPTPEVRFDLRGKAAGQLRQAPGRVWQVRYNAALLARNPEAFLAQTVPHECAHLVAYALFGRGIRPHGEEWQGIMRHFGAEPTRCHSFRVDDLSARRLRRFEYHCACRSHQLTSTRHHRVLAGRAYYCVACRVPLAPGPMPPATAAAPVAGP